MLLYHICEIDLKVFKYIIYVLLCILGYRRVGGLVRDVKGDGGGGGGLKYSVLGTHHVTNISL